MTATDAPSSKAPPPSGYEHYIWPPDSAQPKLDRLRERFNPQAVVTFLVVAAAVVFVFKELQPSQLFANTTPTGGDMGAHVWLPAFVKRALFPHLALNGWAPDWYDGFPALTFFFPLPIWAIALASYVIPYNIAFKLVTVVGLVTLPVAAWAMGRLAKAAFPVPAALGVATLPFIFTRQFTIYGGNIASTMAGEFSFSISLTFAIVFLGLVARGLDNGKHRASAAVILACCGLCHVLPLIFGAVGAVVLVVMSLVSTRDWTRLVRWAVPTGVIAVLLLAFWALPFYWDLPYATNMGYQNLTNYVASLFPGKDLWLVALAALGLVLSAFRSNRLGVFWGIMAALSALVFRFSPQNRLWNARALPFWFLCLYLLAGLALAEGGMLVVEAVRNRRASAAAGEYRASGALVDRARPKAGAKSSGSLGALSVAVVVALASFGWVLYPLHDLPFGHTTSSGAYDWLGITSMDSSFIPDWVYWNYSGYQNPGKSRRNEYFALVAEMAKIGKQYGCGQAMWQYEPELNDMGTPDALMLLPYWTNGCIGSEEGLYYESSATTPFHFLNAAELSVQPANPVRGLDYPASPDVSEGIDHLIMNGDRYFMAETPTIEAAANADPKLKLIATVGPYPVTYTTGSTSTVKQRTWDIYQILGSALVTPLQNQPVVMTGVDTRNPTLWLNAAESWYLDPSRWDVYETATGPSTWARVSPTQTDVPAKALPSVAVTDIVQGTQTISFNVSRTGVPVLVHESYFPNWHVSGARGVYRVTPNLMVVVPTAAHVTLSYTKTAVDWISEILTLIGLAAFVVLWRAGPVVYRAGRNRQRRADVAEPSEQSSPGDEHSPVAPSSDAAGLGGLAPAAGTDEPGEASPSYAIAPPGGEAEVTAPPGGEAEERSPDSTFAPTKVTSEMTEQESFGLEEIFKAYDIRGVYPEQINVALTEAVGMAFAHFAGSARIVVGMDMRPSGPELVKAFSRGATAAGVDVVDIGLCSTDEMYFASGLMDAPGAMFTASHNPARYNGIKLCRSGARPIGVETGLADIKAEVASILSARGSSPAQTAQAPAGAPEPPAGAPGEEAEATPATGKVLYADVLGEYAAKVRSFVDREALRPLKVVADTANGMGGLVVPAVFEGLPMRLEVLYGELDGNFPNHPADPIQPANLVDLQARIRASGADVGLAFDGDADRCFLVDDQGVPLSGSTTTALVAAAMLDKHPGSTILYNLICSKAVAEIIAERGGTAIRTRVGHSYIKAVMAETNALFGGEHSGHYYFRDNFRADSGSIAALVVLEVLSKTDRPLSDLRRDFERYADSGEINTEVSDPHGVIEAVAERFSALPQDRLDGLTVEGTDWWMNLRPSNTEPLLRLNLEADDRQTCDERTAQVLALIDELSGKAGREG